MVAFDSIVKFAVFAVTVALIVDGTLGWDAVVVAVIELLVVEAAPSMAVALDDAAAEVVSVEGCVELVTTGELCGIGNSVVNAVETDAAVAAVRVVIIVVVNADVVTAVVVCSVVTAVDEVV